jgi:hypothetical protein
MNKKPLKVEDWEWAILAGLVACIAFMLTNLPK